MRVFISIDLPERIKNDLILIQKEIDKLGLIRGKFIEPENIHLTLKFLGEISESELRAVQDKLSGFRFKKFNISPDKLGVFSENFVRIIWVSIKGEGLFGLQKNIDSLLEDIFPKEYHFMAHITLARPKFVEDRRMLLDELEKIKIPNHSFQVNRIFIKESRLTKRGPVYRTLNVLNSIEEEPEIAV
ncbi:MAG: RNA 2',3'-cyclic phosphodiesterase [Candidatus Pacearchaeota archaeon]